MRAWSLLVLSFCSCSDSVTEVIAAHRSGVEATFTSLKALKVPEPEPGPVVTDEPIHLEGGDITNAAFIYVEDLLNPGAMAVVPLRSLDSLPLLQCGRLLKDGRLVDSPFAPKPSVVKQYLEACSRVRFAFVIRTVEYFAPKPPPPDSKKFVPGSYRARVVVMDIKRNASLGSYELAIGNDNSINVPDGTPTQEQLIANLEGKAFTALRASTKRSVPGALSR